MENIFFGQRKRFAQSTIEFTILVMVVVGALLAGQVYFKRAIQGRWKASVDELGEELYDPRFTDADIVYRTQANARVDITTIPDGAGYWTMRHDQTNAIETRSGQSLIGGY